MHLFVSVHDVRSEEWVRLLCDVCWTDKFVPDSWHGAKVVSIYKKGDEGGRQGGRKRNTKRRMAGTGAEDNKPGNGIPTHAGRDPPRGRRRARARGKS